MKMPNRVEEERAQADAQEDTDPFSSLVRSDARSIAAPQTGVSAVVLGDLIGIAEDGQTPFVVVRGAANSAAVAARSVVDLHASHIGRQVVLTFENGDAVRPIVMGVLRDGRSSVLAARPGTIEVDCDGERMIIEAKDQLVLRCGRAKLTLTRAGKILIEGTYISSHSSGVNRLKGASIQIN